MNTEQERMLAAFHETYTPWGGENSDPRFNAFSLGWHAALKDLAKVLLAQELNRHLGSGK